MQTVSSVTVMTREILDIAPISKNLQTIGILIRGTSLQGSAQAVTRDVGGSSQGDQYPLSYRGSGASVTSVDGMRVSVVVARASTACSRTTEGPRRSAITPAPIRRRWDRLAFASMWVHGKAAIPSGAR
jgi:hypothetical protein